MSFQNRQKGEEDDMRKIVLVMMLIAISLGATSAYASLVTSLPDGSVIAMPHVHYYGAGPQTVATGITWQSTSGYSVFGYDSFYGFVDNGDWHIIMAGLGTVNGTMTFSFDTPIYGVGGFLNYATPNYGTPSIAVYNSSNNLIESTTLNFSTGGGDNTGYFYGFREENPIISKLTLSNAYIGIADLTVVKEPTTNVPEPTTMLLLGLGLVGLAGVRRKLN
jgi:hypothetical protein